MRALIVSIALTVAALPLLAAQKSPANAGRAQPEDFAGLDEAARTAACSRLPRIEHRFITTGDIRIELGRRFK